MKWEAGGRFNRKWTYVCLWLIHGDVWQKPTQYCEAIILQLKINFKNFLKGKKIKIVVFNFGGILSLHEIFQSYKKA